MIRSTIRVFLMLNIIVLVCSFKYHCKAQELKNTAFTFITSDGIKTPVKVSGKGFPCMFVPGGPGGGYLSFEKLGGNALETHLTMIYMDPRGSGSAQNAKDYSMDRILKDMDEVRANLHIDKMYLLSHSFGGIILINYAKRYPQHVKGLILVNSSLHFFNKASTIEQIEFGNHLLGKDTIIRDQPRDSLVNANMILRQKMNKKHIGYRLLTDSLKTIVELDKLDSIYPRTNDFAYHVLAPFIDKKNKMLYPEYYKDYTNLSAAIKAPTLVITGTKDYAVGINHYKLFKFPKIKIVSINGGHLLYYEKNSDFVKAVFEFIGRTNTNY